MADTKITALAAITTVDPAADVLPIVDVSDTSMAASGTTKKITSNQILGAGGTATLASATITGAATAASLTVTGSSIPTNGLYLPTTNTLEFAANSLAQYRIAPLGVFSWYDGAGGTRMTLNSTGLGVGVSPATKLDVRGTINGNQAIFTGTVNRGLVISTRSDGLADDRTVILNAQHSTGAQGQLVLQTVGTDRLLIDSSGNVGVGVTPSAWTSSYKALQIGTVGAISSGSSSAYGFTLSSNLYQGASGNQYITTGYAGRYDIRTDNGNHVWYTAASGSAGGVISLSTSMTLNAAGSLVLGSGAVATTATDGFLYIPGCAGTPTGTPTAQTGRVPLVVDTTNNKLYFYSGGSWVAAN